MTALTVMVRELRAEARRPWNYWARVAAGAVVIASLGTPVLLGNPGAAAGIQIFENASVVILGLIWTVAPLLTADCLSREKREGTLGLLFLTPLTPAGIVIGKGLVHAVRAASLCLAAVPVLAIALLLGGVSGLAILTSLMHQLGALCLALAAGLLASAWTRDWMRSVILTVCLTAVFASFYYIIRSSLARGGSLESAGLLLLLVLLLFVYAILIAARQIRETWQDGPPPPWAGWLSRTFCSPLFWKEQFRLSMQQRLERNPVGWLHERKTTARLSKWMWCLGAVLLSCGQVSSPRLPGTYLVFGLGLLMAMAFAGAASFRRERQNGLLELILVAPLGFEEIVRSRLGALKKQFLPAVAATALPLLILALWVGGSLNYAFNNSVILPQCLLLVTSLATLPKLGLYFSLVEERFLTAWALTCLVGIGAPFLVARLVVAPSPHAASILGVAALLQVGVTHLIVSAMQPKLNRSALALQKA